MCGLHSSGKKQSFDCRYVAVSSTCVSTQKTLTHLSIPAEEVDLIFYYRGLRSRLLKPTPVPRSEAEPIHEHGDRCQCPKGNARRPEHK